MSPGGGGTLLARVWLALCAHAPCLPFVISIEKGKKIGIIPHGGSMWIRRPFAVPVRTFAKRAKVPRYKSQPRNEHDNLIRAWSDKPVLALSANEATRLRTATLNSLDAMNGHEATALLRAVAQSSIGSAPPWNTLWEHMGLRAETLLPTLKPAELATWGHAFASVGCTSPPLFDKLSSEASKRLDGCSASAAVTLAHAFAVTGHDAPALLRGIGVRLADQLSAARPNEVSTAMWAMAAADVACPELFGSAKFASYVTCATEQGQWATEDRHRMHQWQLWCSERSFSERDARSLPAGLAEACLEEFGAQPPTVSLLQKQVAAAFRRDGLEPKSEVRTPEGYTIDLVVPFKGLHVAVEVDGPSHFLGESDVPNGATRLKRRQLRHLGWAVLPVPYFEFVECKYGDAYQTLNLREALDEMVGPTQNAFHVLKLDPARASLEEAKQAYLQQLKLNHPDTQHWRAEGVLAGDAEERTREIIAAHQTIIRSLSTSDSEWRKELAAAQAKRERRERGSSWEQGEQGDAEFMMAELRAEERRFKLRALREAEEKAEAAARAEAEAKADAAAAEAAAKKKKKAAERAERRRQQAETERQRQEQLALSRQQKKEEKQWQSRAKEEEEFCSRYSGLLAREGLWTVSLIMAAARGIINAKNLVAIREVGYRMHITEEHEELASAIEKMGLLEDRFDSLQGGTWLIIRQVKISKVRFSLAVMARAAQIFAIVNAGWYASYLAFPTRIPPPPILRTYRSVAPYLATQFMPADEWDGARDGHVFKTGPKGLGYYRDFPLHEGRRFGGERPAFATFAIDRHLYGEPPDWAPFTPVRAETSIIGWILGDTRPCETQHVPPLNGEFRVTRWLDGSSEEPFRRRRP